ncbi:hypothetical protein A3A67_02530 [Candidatus Peribacteria bacterium RIFCSPLOWO2_01_FULL_51_18]|nr:MAG: hypothetical protein A3A67_02530 [Candidatus Peribacteria bacterium RIFCSPLOWO2_01_FULL_51_18]
MPSHRPGQAKKFHSIRTTLFLESFAMLLFTVFAVMAATFYLTGRELKMRTAAQLDFAASSKEYLFEMTISRQREQLAILGRDPLLTTLPSVMNLIGFKELLLINSSGKISRLSPGNTQVDPLPETVMEKIKHESRTFFFPVFENKDWPASRSFSTGWSAYLIATPQFDRAGNRTGTLIAIFDPGILIARLLETTYLGKTAEIILAAEDSGGLVLLHSNNTPAGPNLTRLAEIDDRSELFMKTLEGKEGSVETVDYSGIRVLAAYRHLPSIKWAIIVQMDRFELLEPVFRLAANLMGSGLMMVTLLSFTVFVLARHIVSPLEELARKLNNLETRRWKFRRSIFTGNELEIVDRAAFNLTRRLREAHDHLEEKVRERTSALQAQHAEDAAILESIDYGLLVSGRNGKAVYLNKNGELLTGWSSGNVTGSNSTDILKITDRSGREVPPTEHPILKVVRTKQRFNPLTDPEFALFRRDGTQSALHLRVTPILKGRQCLGSVAVFRDITEERRIDHMKSDFITLVSHQLRTPLSSMRWYLEMLLAKDAGSLNSQQEQYVEEVTASNSRMVHLVNALLNVSRLELGKIQLKPEAVDVAKLLSEIKESFKLELKRKKMTVEVHCANPAEIHSDRGLLLLILENLVNNAIKYGRESTSVSAVIALNRPQKTVMFSISDRGIGIPENQQPEIFKKLFRGTNARLSDAEGSGLGLYISHIAAESIGGKLSFHSKEGTGTTFELSVPVELNKTESTKKN